jgi:hypothetical protein
LELEKALISNGEKGEGEGEELKRRKETGLVRLISALE